MSAQPIGDYRGCTLLLYPPTPIRKEPLYGNSCTTGLRYTIDRVKQDIDNYRDKVPEPPPPPEEPEWIEFYRAIEIWREPYEGRYFAAVTRYITVYGDTLAEVRAAIDYELDLLDPPEDPYEGLFAQVVAAIKVWVQDNIISWVTEWGEVVNNWITNVVEEITNVYNYITEQITNVYNDLSTYVTNVFNTVNEYVTNVFNAYNEYITNVHNTFNEYVTNIIGVSEESVNERIKGVTSWTLGLFAVLDPQGVLKDPFGFIKAAFDTLIAPWGQGIVEAFWTGFEEGLEE